MTVDVSDEKQIIDFNFLKSSIDAASKPNERDHQTVNNELLGIPRFGNNFQARLFYESLLEDETYLKLLKYAKSKKICIKVFYKDASLQIFISKVLSRRKKNS